MTDSRPASGARRRPLSDHGFVRAGVYAWAAVGLAVALWIVLLVLDRVRLAVVPLVLA